LRQWVISSRTLSVIRLIVSLETEAPQISAKCALISPVVGPLAYSDSTISSTPLSRRWRFLTICGLERTSPVPGHVDADLAGALGQHRVGSGAITHVPRRLAVPFMPQVLGQPLVQRQLIRRSAVACGPRPAAASCDR
jgi:hypothetical protein